MFRKKLWEEIRTIWGKLDWLLEKQATANSIDNTIIFCEKCGVAVKKDKIKRIEIKFHKGKDFYPYEPILISKYYCDRHAPNYDRKEHNLEGEKYYKDNVEVDEKGSIIKDKK